MGVTATFAGGRFTEGLRQPILAAAGGQSRACSPSAYTPFAYWRMQHSAWSRHESLLNKSLNLSFFFSPCPVPFFFSLYVAAFIFFSPSFAKSCLHFKNMNSSSNNNISSPICRLPFDFTGFAFAIYKRAFSFLYDPNYLSFLGDMFSKSLQSLDQRTRISPYFFLPGSF